MQARHAVLVALGGDGGQVQEPVGAEAGEERRGEGRVVGVLAEQVTDLGDPRVVAADDLPGEVHREGCLFLALPVPEQVRVAFQRFQGSQVPGREDPAVHGAPGARGARARAGEELVDDPGVRGGEGRGLHDLPGPREGAFQCFDQYLVLGAEAGLFGVQGLGGLLARGVPGPCRAGQGVLPVGGGQRPGQPRCLLPVGAPRGPHGSLVVFLGRGPAAVQRRDVDLDGVADFPGQVRQCLPCGPDVFSGGSCGPAEAFHLRGDRVPGLPGPVLP